MGKRNRLASIIITAALMIALLPATAFAADYDLWVGEVRVTDANKDNITGASGVATFDSDTNTLTLDGFEYTGKGGSKFTVEDVGDAYAAVYSNIDNLKITLKNENALTHTAYSGYDSYGIYAEKGLTITEESTGTLDVASANDVNRSIGIYIRYNDFNVNGGEVTAVGGKAASTDLSSGIWCFDGNITVGENVNLIGIGGEAGKSYGVCAFDKIINNGGTIEGTSGEAGYLSRGISLGTIESTSEKSKIIGTAGTSTGESAGIYIWNSATFSKGHMKGIGGSSSTDESYGIYVNGDDKLTVIGGTVTAQGKTRNVVYLNDGGEGEAIPAPDSSPNTGDNSNMILWLALLLVSGGVIIVAVVLGRKRK
ncbi:MAG: hypothetical protein Q4F78_08105 [Bacillota bacterium]|nr:hypothetical protein [Bacillota bacterium]